MTLAAILLGVLFPLQTFSLQSLPVYAQAQPAPAAKSSDASTQDQSNSQSESPAPSQAPSTSKAAPSNTATKPPMRHKKKVVQANCDPATKAGTSSTATNSAPSVKPAADPTTQGSTAPAGTGSTSSNCPPTKKIVTDGGTSERTIHLAGDANKSSPPLAGSVQCHEPNQCLQAAEVNLKKIAGQQLDSNKQEMVGQVQKFMDQSKKATEAGDLDGARTLAWKAQTLSEQLLPPQK